MNKLTDPQRDELIQQFVEIQVDNMDMGAMIQIVSEYFIDFYDKCSDVELEQEIDSYDKNLYNELVDNVTQQYPKQLNEFEKDTSPYDQIPARY